MKKLALTTICALAVASAAFAQGTLNWSTLAPGGLTVQQNTGLSPLFGGTPSVSGVYVGTGLGAYYFALLYNTAFTGSAIAAPNLAALTGSDWIDTGFVGYNSTASAGKVIPVSGTASTAKVPNGTWAGGIGTLGGTTNNIVLVGWSANMGTSWAAAKAELATWDQSYAAFFGVTATGYIVPNIAPANGPALFSNVATLNGRPIFSLNTQLYALPIPEPSTFALAGLGALALLVFRRRQ